MGLRDRSFISKAPNPAPTRFNEPRQLVLPIPGLTAGPYALLDCPGRSDPIADETAMEMAHGRRGWLGALVGGKMDRHWLPDGWRFEELSFLRWRVTGWAVVVKARDDHGQVWRAWVNEMDRDALVRALIWLVRRQALPWRKMSRK